MSAWMLGWNGVLHSGFWLALGVALLATHLTILSTTLYLHRGVAHRAVVFHPWLELAFRLWLWLTTGMSTLEWAAVHRKHHAKCESPEDPHSPAQVGLSKVLWGGALLYTREAANPQTIERYGKGAPNDRLEAFFRAHSLAGVGMTLALDLFLFGAWGLMVFALQMVWIPFWAAGVVNGLGHHWGYRNFNSEDRSRNLFPWGIVIGGEELHNNHHAFPASAKFSAKKGELDIGWIWLRALSAVKLAQIKKANRAPVLGPQAPVDQRMLEALLAHRHHAQADARRVLMPMLRHRFAKARNSGAFDTVAGGRRTRFRHFRAWFFEDSARQPSAQHKACFDALLTRDRLLARARQSSLSLNTLWERSHVSAEELCERLHNWCAHAQRSPLEALRRLEARLRCYRAAHAT